MQLKSLLKNPLFFGTLLLTGTGLMTRVIGFFYRIYLSRVLGAEGLGLYQLIFPVYNVCYALCCGALQTALSRFVAVEAAKTRNGKPHSYLASSCLLAFATAVGLASLMYHYSDWIAEILLLELRCAPFLRILALALPFNAIHACIYGYYYGLKRAKVPAMSQLFEQIVRVAVVVTLCERSFSAGQAPSVILVIVGLVAGEIAALFLSLVCLTRLLATSALAPLHPGEMLSHGRKLCTLSIPLCLNRVTLNLLQSAEAVLIPGSLQLFGLNNADALSIYGVFTGMALPFILFPTAVTNSLAVMLLPDVAEASAKDDDARISRTTGLTVRYCLYIGILFLGIFTTYGPDMGVIIFANEQAGRFIQILAWLCPFLYLSGTLASILNGLELAGRVFLHSLLGLTLRLAFVVFGIPRLGILAYLYGALVSQLLITALHLTSFCRHYTLDFRAGYALLRPLLCSGICCLALTFLRTKTASVLFGSPFLTLAASCALFALLFLLLLFLTRDRREVGALSL